MKYLQYFTQYSKAAFSSKQVISNQNAISTKFYVNASRIINSPELLASELNLMKRNNGLVVVINGVSSCGKSSLAAYLSNKGFVPFSFDKTYKEQWLNLITCNSPASMLTKLSNSPNLINNLWKSYLGLNVEWNDKNFADSEEACIVKKNLSSIAKDPLILHDQTIYNRIYDLAYPTLAFGGCISVDAVFDEEGFSYLNQSFGKGYHKMIYVLRYEPLYNNLKRVVDRNIQAIEKETSEFRNPTLVLKNFMDLYSLKPLNQLTSENLIIDKLARSSIDNSIEITKEHLIIYAKTFFITSSNNQKCFLEDSFKIIKSVENILNQAEEFCVIANTYADFIVRIELGGEIN